MVPVGSRMDSTVLFLLFLGVSVGAHVTIAWTAISHHARKQETKWSKKVTEEWLPQSVASVEEHIKDLDIAGGIEGWLQSERGRQVVGSAITTAADVTQEKMSAWLAGLHGNAVKEANAGAGKTLLTELAAMDLGNPVINGIWAIGVRAAGPKVLGRIAGWARNRGLELGPNEWAEIGIMPTSEETGMTSWPQNR
jgi:hypothetical protein